MLNTIIWWTGAAAIALGATFSIATGGLWTLDRTLKAFGLWPRALQLVARMYRERVERSEPGAH